MRIVFKILIIISLGVSVMGCDSFAGILFPKTIYRFRPSGELPPFNVTERLNAGAKYPETFSIIFIRRGNSFTYDFDTAIFANKPYSVLYIKEMGTSKNHGNQFSIKTY